MDSAILSQRMSKLLQVLDSTMEAISPLLSSETLHDADACDFGLGNPHEMPLPDYVEALRRAAVPQSVDWFAYKENEPEQRRLIAESLRIQRGQPFEPEDIFFTGGSFGGLAVTLATLLDPGQEVIINIPPWFFYEGMILNNGGVPVKVPVDPNSFDLDLHAIRQALTPRTRAIIVNTPNNPTGRIYPAETLSGLADVLTEASERYGHPIYLISDESYCRIVYHPSRFISPARFYPHTLVVYTYGKTLLVPGQRLGYVALAPEMPDREPLRQALFIAQMINGHLFPNALLLHALADLEGLSIDVEALQHSRDWMVGALKRMGYDVHSPEGTFYLFPRSPIPDDAVFAKLLANRKVFVLPGKACEWPGHFRISLTATDEMIERGLPLFAAALEEVRGRKVVEQA